MGIAAVGGAAALFIHPGGEHHEVGAGKLSVVTVAQCNLGTKRRAVAQIGGDRLGSRPGPVDDDNLARRTACNERQRAGRTDPAGSDDSDFHSQA